MEFDAETIQAFIRDGFLHYPEAIPSELIAECREWMIEDAGINMSDPSSWIEPVVRIGGSRAKCFWHVSKTDGQLTRRFFSGLVKRHIMRGEVE